MTNLSEQIKTYASTHKEELLSFLSELIAIESVTYNEGKIVSFLADKMKEFGFDEVRIDEVGNVMGRVGSGKTTILYDAHTDTVELGDKEKWGQDPLKATLTPEGELKGRGAVDDKGCLAAITFAGKAIKELSETQDFTLWVSGSISEEDVEGSCAGAMLDLQPDVKPDFILVAEASGNRLVRGHKGRALIKISVPGKAAHASAAWRGDNALIKALPIIKAIDDFNDFTEDAFLGKGTIEVTHVDCKTPSLNTIPGEVIITCDRRMALGESIEDLLKEIEPIVSLVPGAKASIDVEHVKTYTGYDVECVDYFPSWVMEEDSPIVQGGIKAFQEVYKKDPVIGRWDFSTNATFLCGITGIPALGFGPGDESLCHSTEDKVPVDELIEALQFYIQFPFSLTE